MPPFPESRSSPALVSLAEIAEAHAAIAPHVHRTPVVSSRYLGEQSGTRVVLKLELFQKTGSFKPRGVVNTLRQLTEEERVRGVVSISAGNHAQALAWGAARLGIRATIVMPATASPSKIRAAEGYGGEVVLTADDLLATMQQLQHERSLTLVHPFDDPRVIAGQGTVGMEILDDVPDADVVIVACGGGGLISGVAAAVKARRPATRVVGVEPSASDAMTRSLAAGSPQRLEPHTTIADGLAAPFAGVHTLAHCQALVDEWVLVREEEIVAGMRVLFERCKVAAEPAAGAAVAPLLTGQLALPPDATVVVVVCGGNIDLARLASLL